MVASAMESKRLGMCSKSLFVVPNHLTGQIGREFMQLYPYVNDAIVSRYDYVKENGSIEKALDVMKFEMENGEFNTFISVDEEELRQATGLYIDDEGNFYDPLSKDLDNDGIPDRCDNDFKDSDYFESTYDVEDNLNSKEEASQKTDDKPSILGQIRAYQEKSKTEEKQKTKEQEILR